MIEGTIRTSGGSAILTLPKAVMEAYDLQPNRKVEFVFEADGIKLKQRKRPKYTAAELLAQCDPSVPMSDEELEWLNMPSVGAEIIE